MVMAGEGPMLVIAGAGSGKTRTLTYRVSRLIEDGRRSARDPPRSRSRTRPRARCSAASRSCSPTDTRRIWGGTFHSIGNRLLRRHAERLGYRSNFTILDAEDAKEMMESAISSLGIKTLEKRFPKGDVLLDIYSFPHQHAPPARELLARAATRTSLDVRDEIVNVFRRYKERKREANAMDFDDLLVFWKRAARRARRGRAPQLQRRFRHILVDEYQDTNKLQADIVDAMASVAHAT